MPCPICNIPQANESMLDSLAQNFLIDCPRCGKFKVTDMFRLTRPELSTNQVANASGWVHENGTGLHLEEKSWEYIKTIQTPSVGEKADKLLLYLAKKFPQPNAEIIFNTDLDVIAVSWSSSPDEVNFLLLEYLKDYKNFINPAHNISSHIVKISPKGWDYIHSLMNPNQDSNIGFCAMWFDKTMEPIWEQGIEPGISNAGYLAKRIDKHQHNNRIDDEIIAMIRRSKFIVADFTGNRGGVYFEAGYALGLGIQVVWTVKEEELKQVHFDNRQYSFLTWTPDKMAEFKTNLQYRIEATIGQGSQT